MTWDRSPYRRRRALGTLTACGLLASMLTLAPSPTGSAGAETSEGPIPGEVITVPLPSEPEFLLVAGGERWNVRNRPAGTVASAYGRPTGAVDDTYMATARYPAAAVGDRQLLDLSFHAPTSSGTSWYFARPRHGMAEVWGPGNDGLRDRFVLEPGPGEAIVGGTVQTTVQRPVDPSEPGGEKRLVPVVIAVFDDGTLRWFEGSRATGSGSSPGCSAVPSPPWAVPSRRWAARHR